MNEINKETIKNYPHTLFPEFQDKEVVIFLKNKFRYQGILRGISLNSFLIFYDQKDKKTRLISLNEISIIELQEDAR